MNQHGSFKISISISIFQSKFLWKLNIELDRAALVVSTDAVLDQHVDLGCVECPISLLYRILERLLIQNGSQLRFRLFPLLILADRLWVKGRGSPHIPGLRGEHERIAEVQPAVDRFDYLQQPSDLLSYLILSTEDVTVILSVTAALHSHLMEHVQTGQTSQSARVLLSMNRRELSITDREISAVSREDKEYRYEWTLLL